MINTELVSKLDDKEVISVGIIENSDVFSDTLLIMIFTDGTELKVGYSANEGRMEVNGEPVIVSDDPFGKQRNR